MKRIYYIIFLIVSGFISGNLHGQKIYAHANKTNPSIDFIYFFDNGCFSIIHDEQCYSYPSHNGLYKTVGDSIFLKYFKGQESTIKIKKKLSSEAQPQVSVKVFSLRDSTILEKSLLALKDKDQLYQYIENEENGEFSFSIPAGKKTTQVYLYDEIHSTYQFTISDSLIYKYELEIYLSVDPLKDIYYSGPFYKQETAYFRNKNRLIIEGKTFIRQ